ncbi:unnamed protein product [Rhizophagus irregularis]|uniref:Uncharacterized protein n=1 Tax=Rhizophagus irregularis TaxID=588596 RepID=A0A2I1HF84_9GLOM|nr:hypothetical protein RhiirA4_478666 [Rhizophagus irregularis]CAB4429344.1 unnamed protein product [Rhizophagus irregularis]CAB4429405.1 unnamed protein product [Rhizophagus irregularis]
MAFSFYPGVKDCLKNLAELRRGSVISIKTFYQLSRTCYNIQSFTIEFKKIISNGMADLISVQRNLKHFDMMLYHDCSICGGMHYIPLSFIVNFSNLQELKLSFNLEECFVDFEELQDVIFPKLQVLKIRDEFPDDGSLERFIENNGKV